MRVISTELAAMVDFEFTPGNPPETLAEQLALAEAVEPYRAEYEQLRAPAMVGRTPSRPGQPLRPALRPGATSLLASSDGPAGIAAFSWVPDSIPDGLARGREAWSSNARSAREAWARKLGWRGPPEEEGDEAPLPPPPGWPDGVPYSYRYDEYLRGLPSSLARDYEESESWLWYRSEWLGAGEAPLFSQRRRVYLEGPDGHPEVRGLQVLLLPQRGAGVVSVWISDKRWTDPWQAKHLLWANPEYWKELLEPSGLLRETALSSERNYIFLAVRVDEPDLTAFCRDEAAAVASWFTGGYEHESLDHIYDLVGLDSNLSHRSYERLFLRWTDALALYNLDSLRSEALRESLRRGQPLYGDFDREYRLTRCRAAQLFEHCILARRILRTDGRKIAKLSTRATPLQSAPVVSRSWREANNVLTSFAQAEFEMVTAPPFRSVEASDLVRRAIERCGVPMLVEDTHRAYDLLERRLQWARGQWLAIIAVFAFFADAIIALAKA